MGQAGVKLQAAAAPEIPDKLYFRIGEVGKLLSVEPYVLRYWEKEFPALAPKKSGTGHRFYRRKDVELLLEIRQLLYEKRYTIEGARKHLEAQAKQSRRERSSKPPVRAAQADLFAAPPPGLDEIRRELQSLLELLR